MLHFTAYTCIIIHISSFFTECLDKFTPSSHTGLIICRYVILLFGDTSQRYIRTLADIAELLLCICTQYTAGARFSLARYDYTLSYHVCMYSRCNGMLHSNISLTEPDVSNVSVTKSVEDGNSILNVSWTTPLSELPIIEYEVEYRTSDTKSWINSTQLSVSPPANSTLLTGLDAGVEYIIRVRALSEIGAGAWSEEQRVRTDDSECL